MFITPTALNITKKKSNKIYANISYDEKKKATSLVGLNGSSR